MASIKGFSKNRVEDEQEMAHQHVSFFLPAWKLSLDLKVEKKSQILYFLKHSLEIFIKTSLPIAQRVA